MANDDSNYNFDVSNFVYVYVRRSSVLLLFRQIKRQRNGKFSVISNPKQVISNRQNVGRRQWAVCSLCSTYFNCVRSTRFGVNWKNREWFHSIECWRRSASYAWTEFIWIFNFLIYFLQCIDWYIIYILYIVSSLSLSLANPYSFSRTIIHWFTYTFTIINIDFWFQFFVCSFLYI